MFQNISEELRKEEYGDISEKNNKVKAILKNLLKIQNILVYILSFCISTVQLGIEVPLFGVVMFAVACGSNIPAGIVLISAGLGTLFGLGINKFIEYIITSALFLGLSIVIRKKSINSYENETNKVGLNLFIATLVVQIAKYVLNGNLLYDLFICIIGTILTYVFYKIFVNSIIVVKEFHIKTAFSIEEIIGASVMIAIATYAFHGINIMGFNISNIVVILLILILGWKNGMLVGATSGIAMGVILGMLNAIVPVQIAIYGIAGMFAGILNRFGKIGVALGFILGNILITYVANGSTSIIISMREVFIASLGLLLIPKSVEINIKDFMGKDNLLESTGDKRLGTNKDMERDLDNVSNTINEMIKSYDEAAVTLIEKNECDNNREQKKKKFVECILDELDNCQNNIFYEELIENDDLLINQIYDKCVEKEVILEKDLVDIFEKNNNFIVMEDEKLKEDLLKIVRITNRVYKTNEINDFWKHKELSNKKTMTTQLKGVSKAILNIKEKVLEEENFEALNKEVKVLLNQRNIKCISANIKQNASKKYIIKLQLNIQDTMLKEPDKIRSIENLLTKALRSSIKFQNDFKDLDKQEYEQIYETEDKYSLQVGTSKITKHGSDVSGDSNMQMRLEDGKYMLLISDGMGSGKEARDSSKIVVKMMKNLLSTGFNNKETIDLINSTISSSAKEEMFATIDMAILDLYEGNIEFIKNGSCCTYIKNKTNVKKVSLENLPVGIIEDAEISTYERNVHDGDIIIMCSDGIIESKEEIKNTDWLEKFIKNINTNNVQKIADLILAEAIDNNYGIPKDDMTVIVSKIVAKK